MKHALSDIEVIQIGADELGEYARVPIRFQTTSIFEVREQENGDYTLQEHDIDLPLNKNYDLIEGESPQRWALQFDVSGWGFLLAQAGAEVVGAATVACRTPGVDMLEGRTDLAVLWDIRVMPECRGQGIGSALLKAAEHWAREAGCREIKIETQNTNPSACKFYESFGYTLRSVRPFAYPDFPDETQLLWFKDLTVRTPILSPL